MEHAGHHMDDGSTMHGHEGMGMNCDGVGLSGEGGTLIGHVLPGVLFVVWGSWWAYNVCLRCALQTHNHVSFNSKPWYKLPSRRNTIASLIEPILKIVLPCIALSMELYLDHLSEGFQHLYCPKGTKHEGEFAGDNVNNWQHASSYPAVITSGVVDILSHYVSLPPGVNRAFSAMWIGIMGFLMLVHEKHEALDKMVHWLLAVAMLIAFFFHVLEVFAKKSPVVSLGKSVSTIFVGAWLIQIGRMMYSGAPEWTKSRSIGAMLAPVFFCMIFLLISIAVLFLYVFIVMLQKKNMFPKMLYTAAVESTADDEQSLLPRHRQDHHVNLSDVIAHKKKVQNSLSMEMADRTPILYSEESFDNDSALCSSE
jgi:hypothetical protein